MTNQIIVLGGSGFLGSHVISKIKKSKIANVTCGDLFYNQSLDCEFKKIDLLNKNETIDNLKGFDTVINCIGQITNPFNLCFKLNSIGINNLANALEKYKPRIIHLSSLAVYGSTEICNEQTILNPETNYATAKAYAEFLLLSKCNNKKVSILRLPNLYGHNQKKGICAYLMKSYRTDQKLTFNNNGSLVRSFMHVKDCVDIIYSIVMNNKINGVFNLPGPEIFSVKEIIEKFEIQFNMKFETHFSNQEPWENIYKFEDYYLKSIHDFKPKFKMFDFFENRINGK